MLINQAAIALTRANAYAAARQVLGAKTPTDVLFTAADDYLKFVVPKTNRALMTPEIVHDINFFKIAKAAKSAGAEAKKEKDAGPLIEPGSFGLTESMFGDIPNYLIYGGVAAVGYWYYRKHKKGKKSKSKRRSSRRSAPVSMGVIA